MLLCVSFLPSISVEDLASELVNRNAFLRTAYNEMLKCMKENGDDSAKCTVYSHAAFTMCPRDWVNNFRFSRMNCSSIIKLIFPSQIVQLAAWKEARQLREVSDGHGGTKTVHNFYGVDHGTTDTGDDEEDDDDDDDE